MNKILLLLSILLSLSLQHVSFADGITLEIPGELPGQYNKIPLEEFVEAHRYEKASDLITKADAWNNLNPATTQSCLLAAAYELAAILAGDTDLMSWAFNKFGVDKVEKFIEDGADVQMQEALFNSLKEC